MKKKLTILSMLAVSFLISSCEIHFFPESSSPSPDVPSSNSSDFVPDISVSDDESDTSSASVSPWAGTGTVTLYSINDFHGAVIQNQDTNEIGLLNIGTYFKKKGEDGNTLLINSGDLFQGSIESNYNRGKFLTDAMDIIGFDVFTVGNHEFDWGQDVLRGLANRKTYDYKTTWISSNIYKWDDAAKAASNERVSDFGSLYKTQVLDNGLKVGFIGAIGSDQWTSITSGYVSDLTFVDPIPVIKAVSDVLKKDKGCDLVFLTYHGSQDELLNQGLTDVSSVSNKKYVDSVFCAHTHQQETATENGVIFTQNNSNGKNASKITLTIGADKTVAKANREVLYWSSIVNEVNGNYDSTLKACYDSYTAETSSIGSEVQATLSGEFNKTFANVAADAMLEEAISQGYSPVLAMTNKVRSYPEEGELTYAQLMKSIPFENAAVIMTATGSDIKKEASYNFVAINPTFTGTLSSTKTYQIVCIDYLAYHMGTSHEYDYFPSFKYVNELKEGDHMYGYRDITSAYLKKKKTISAADYASTLDKFNKSKL